jgi:hypothetical protein
LRDHRQDTPQIEEAEEHGRLDEGRERGEDSAASHDGERGEEIGKEAESGAHQGSLQPLRAALRRATPAMASQ